MFAYCNYGFTTARVVITEIKGMIVNHGLRKQHLNAPARFAVILDSAVVNRGVMGNIRPPYSPHRASIEILLFPRRKQP